MRCLFRQRHGPRRSAARWPGISKTGAFGRPGSSQVRAADSRPVSPGDAVRALSFGAVAEAYDRLRPTPPDEIVDWLLPANPSLVVDLAAGTGAMTRQLERRAGEVVAVEPDVRMLAVLKRRGPAVRAVSGRSEALPLQDGVADAVIISSAWHWMDPELTVPEIARVLRDGGRFGVVWNGRDHRDPLMQELAAAAMLRPSNRDQQRLVRRLRELTLPPGSPFGEVESRLLPFVRSMTVDELAESLGTYSRAQEGPGGVEGTVQRARDFLVDRFGPDARLEVPMGSRAFRCERLPRS